MALTTLTGNYQKQNLCPHLVTPYNLLSHYHSSNSLVVLKRIPSLAGEFQNPPHVLISKQQFLCHLATVFSSFNRFSVAKSRTGDPAFLFFQLRKWSQLVNGLLLWENILLRTN